MDLFSQESEASTSQPNGWDGKINSIANGTNLGKKSYTITGQKRSNTPISQSPTLWSGEEKSTSSRVDFLASPTQAQEKDSEKKMNAIYGQKCLESFEKFSHVTSWAKMFSALLIGTEGWYSRKCKLIWKLKGTKYKRMYFQLQPSMLPIEGTEFGLLPTVTAMDSTQATSSMKSTQVKEGSMHSVTLSRAMSMGMLPTPTTHDRKHSTHKSPSWGKRIEQKHLAETVLNPYIEEQGGNPSQLNPRFVLEMMGFPANWTELPFLSGDKNQLKQQETQ